MGDEGVCMYEVTYIKTQIKSMVRFGKKTFWDVERFLYTYMIQSIAFLPSPSRYLFHISTVKKKIKIFPSKFLPRDDLGPNPS